ncbi:MAG TPA: M1 family metallopeptidase [Pyrinomonadaceae bacterium]|nr:M1 family metallopeptidase [Pyrinomonadaceae bacterium]
MIYRYLFCLLILIALGSTIVNAQDVHSYSNPSAVRVRHVDLDWNVLFDQKILKGTTTLTIERTSPAEPLILDTRDLKIDRVETSANGFRYSPATFTVGARDKVLGAPLTIPLPARANRVRIHYSTDPTASGLQWLQPSQTAGKKDPFVFTQSQAIHARSWIPLQDTPQVRVTYTARVRTPRHLLAVMSADNVSGTARDGDYQFRMRQPIPSYLIALGVGDLRFRSLGPRTGVYAEPSVIDLAARELSDTEKMVVATERLYGPYRWDRYDILVLPPSFPYGGMENPRLTFATPTILAGDKSLVSLIAHELAHSWSGNLVTNATWRDFWLNEGFTTYLERRILEAVYGHAREEMEATLGLRDLNDDIATLPDADEILHIDLQGRDPDEGSTDIPYEKGALFLRHLEQTFGRAAFDRFLRGYFNHFAFQSITTEQFVTYLKQNLLDKNPALAERVPVDEWIYKPGLPASAPKPSSSAFTRVEEQAKRWLRGEVPATKIETAKWTTQEWLHFLKFVQDQVTKGIEGERIVLSVPPGTAPPSQRMTELDSAFNLTRSGNSEIAFQWLVMSIRNRYEPAYPRLEEFLMSIGRRKFIKPLYEELAKTPEGKARAMRIYARARSTYHPIAVTSVDDVLKWPSE